MTPIVQAGSSVRSDGGVQPNRGNCRWHGHLLSFDVEEFFQVEAAAAAVCPSQWDNWPKRLARPLDVILELLAEHKTLATFFVLGWVARHEGHLVRRIAKQGHEIASHGMSHSMLTRISPEGFRRELLDSRRLLEDTCGQSVKGYRAPTFSVTNQTAWVLDVLAENDFLYDSSVFPIRHDRYGVPDAPTAAHFGLGPAGNRILELPPLTLRLMGANWPVGGGGYLRLFGARINQLALKRAQRHNYPGLLYLHPWEFDPTQPRLPMSRLSRWRHTVGLRSTERKLRWLLSRFNFGCILPYARSVASASLPSYSYGPAVAGQCGPRR